MRKTASASQPPRLATRLLALALPGFVRHEVLGDLAEVFTQRTHALGARKARRWYWRQVVATPWRVAADRTRRDTGSGGWLPGIVMQGAYRDLRFALRRGRKAPGYRIIGIVVLALGIGGTTAIYSVFSSFLWLPVDLAHADSLFWLGTSSATEPRAWGTAVSELEDVQRAVGELGTVIASNAIPMTVRLEGNGEQMMGGIVTPGLFGTLQVPLRAGRGFTRSSAAELEVIVSELMWREHLGVRPDVIGSTLHVDRVARTVVGVITDGTAGIVPIGRPRLWLPADLDAESLSLLPIVLLADHATVPAVTAALQVRLDNSDATTEPRRALVVALRDRGTVQEGSGGIAFAWAVLTGLSGLVVLVACANVSSMLLVDGIGRRREFQTRAALGASRGRLVRLALMETALLGVPAGALGLALARALVRQVPSWLPQSPYLADIPFRLGGSTVTIAVIAAAVAIALAGVAPAWGAGRMGTVVPTALRARSSSGGSSRLQRVLVVAQVAASVTLLAAAALVTRNLAAIHDRPLGYAEEDRFQIAVSAPGDSYSPAQFEQLRGELLSRAKGLASVRDTTWLAQALITVIPKKARTNDPEGPSAQARRLEVTPNYFGVMNSPIIAGRVLGGTVEDREAVITSTLAETLWPDESPLGKSVIVEADKDANTYNVVGVAAAGSHALSFEQAVLFTLPREARLSGFLIVHAPGAPASLAEDLRTVFSELDPDLPAPGPIPVSEWFDRAWLLQRAMGAFARGLGLVGLLITTFGVYGQFASLVARRKQEIGIRMALGAAPHRASRYVLRRSLMLVGVGALIGLVLATFIGAGLNTLLVMTSLFPVGLYAGVIATVFLAAIVATYPAARRAAHIDPAKAIRAE